MLSQEFRDILLGLRKKIQETISNKDTRARNAQDWKHSTDIPQKDPNLSRADLPQEVDDQSLMRSLKFNHEMWSRRHKTKRAHSGELFFFVVFRRKVQ